MDPLRYERELRLASSPAALWPAVSNTDRLNRALGLPAVESEPEGPGFARRAKSKVLGLPVEWRELPFEFAAGRGHRVTREYASGPLILFRGGVTLEPDGTGTRAVVFGEFTPRGALGAALVRLTAPTAVGRMAALIRRADESLARVGELPDLPRARTGNDETALAARGALLRASAADPAAAERLVDHLRAAPDDEVARLRPYELADRWGLPRDAALSACLHAVKAGLLDLRWETLCPNCSAPPEASGSLSGLAPHAHCGSCALDFSADLAESVELRFSIHPEVRAARAAVFCAGSPAHSPQALAQTLLAPGETRELELDLESRAYRVRGLGSRAAVALVPRADGAEVLDLSLPADGEAAFKPGRVRLRLSAKRPELVRVESEAWRDAAATAARAAALQDFRDLFSAEVLSPGVEIGVKRLALLFTDLKDSTALYERVGDAPAYAIVRDHFDYLRGIVAARGGAVVKTIGDAVMAVFASPAAAVEAALDMQERRADLDAALAPRDPVVLKIGVHEGPAIAINADGVLDYFGTTANLAARVQGESKGDDVVVTETTRRDPAVAKVLERRAPPLEPFESELKGLIGSHRLWRLRPKRR
jgi:class 3 adenylate cyclase